MSDLVKRLRDHEGRHKYILPLLTSAADRIESLETQLREAREESKNWQEAAGRYADSNQQKLETIERVRGLQKHTVEKDEFSHCYVVMSCAVRNGEVVYADELDKALSND